MLFGAVHGTVVVPTGNQVMVDATVSGSTATAVRIVDLSSLQPGFQRFFDGVHGPSFKMVAP